MTCIVYTSIIFVIRNSVHNKSLHSQLTINSRAYLTTRAVVFTDPHAGSQPGQPGCRSLCEVSRRGEGVSYVMGTLVFSSHLCSPMDDSQGGM
jgi:hypothetical protein